MKKVPTIFQRDWDGDRSRVTREPHFECWWVFDGEGVATQKLDGTACLVRNGRLYRREVIVEGKPEPFGWIQADRQEPDQEGKPAKLIGWVPVGDGPEDRWHREAFTRLNAGGYQALPPGTYELIGPKIQGNPEKSPYHQLVKHTMAPVIDDCPRDFDGLRDLLADSDIEGIVFHHSDGRMGKIKARDFGLKRS